MSLSKKEQKAIDKLNELAKTWPKSLWLFSASGSLVVMKKGDDGKRVYTESGGVDQDFVVCDVGIENDGGDW